MDEPTLADLTFWAVDGGSDPGVRAPGLLAAAWPAYRAWFLRDGEEARPSYLEGRRAIAAHLPELLDTYDDLVEACGGGDLEARFLSQWCPPPLFAACSLAAWTAGPHVLIRSYDYPPVLCDRTALRTAWNGRTVLGMADCVWGVLDGINDAGLAVALAFGGRPQVGPGFGIGLVVRYLLQACADVDEAVAVLSRVPVQLSYNVALLDRHGQAAVIQVAPDRAARRAPTLTAGNRQGETEWPEHALFCGTEPRERALAEQMERADASVTALEAAFLEAPLQRPLAEVAWGTVYTAAYDVDALTLDLLWPEERWTLPMHGFAEGVRPRVGWVAPPPARHVAAPVGPHGRPLLIA